MMRIRRFQPSDLTRVTDIEAHSFMEGAPGLYVAVYRMQGEGFFVAEVDGEVAGYVVAALAEDGEGRIFSVAVDPRHRRRGIARVLLNRAFEFYRGHRILSVCLEVRQGNLHAQALYRDFGFSVVGLIPGYYSDGEDALVMRRRLDPGPPEGLSARKIAAS
ncbi:MAG: ribosomal protein S18-alanine N-acetyltransferase [Euryarchaeota archaeon]|nr:ribosomal protein S18-alanine N-acetyltransferase [Euryarchaeota archaeon]